MMHNDTEKRCQESCTKALKEIKEKIGYIYKDAERRRKGKTILNRCKFARDNETPGESYARNQGFKSACIIVTKVINEKIEELESLAEDNTVAGDGDRSVHVRHIQTIKERYMK